MSLLEDPCDEVGYTGCWIHEEKIKCPAYCVWSLNDGKGACRAASGGACMSDDHCQTGAVCSNTSVVESSTRRWNVVVGGESSRHCKCDDEKPEDECGICGGDGMPVGPLLPLAMAAETESASESGLTYGMRYAMTTKKSACSTSETMQPAICAEGAPRVARGERWRES